MTGHNKLPSLPVSLGSKVAESIRSPSESEKFLGETHLRKVLGTSQPKIVRDNLLGDAGP